jgi:hypothetical protein
MIKANWKMRELYIKHIKENYIDNFRSYDEKGRICYMCLAAGNNCNYCPLDDKYIGGYCIKTGPKTRKARMNWIVDMIHKHTDCVIEDDL